MIEATGVWPLDENPGWIGQIHRRTDVALGYGLRPQEAAVVRGMVLGDRSLIPEDLELAFQRSGITQVPPTKDRCCLIVSTVRYPNYSGPLCEPHDPPPRMLSVSEKQQ